MIVNSIINNINMGKYNTALIKKAPAGLGKRYAAFPDPTFTGCCFIKNVYNSIDYSVLLENGQPIQLYTGNGAVYSIVDKPSYSRNLESKIIDVDHQDLQRLWNVISVIENNKRQK